MVEVTGWSVGVMWVSNIPLLTKNTQKIDPQIDEMRATFPVEKPM